MIEKPHFTTTLISIEIIKRLLRNDMAFNTFQSERLNQIRSRDGQTLN